MNFQHRKNVVFIKSPGVITEGIVEVVLIVFKELNSTFFDEFRVEENFIIVLIKNLKVITERIVELVLTVFKELNSTLFDEFHVDENFCSQEVLDLLVKLLLKWF